MIHHPMFILSVLSSLIVVVAGMCARRSLSREMKLLLLYFSFATLADFTSAYLAINRINNLWLFHVFTIIEYGFLIAIFSSWQNNQMLKKILLISIPIFTLMVLLSMLFLENLHQVNNFSKPVASLILVAASGYILFELNKETFGSVFAQPRFWVGSATLIYYSSTLVLFALSNALINLPTERIYIFFEFYAFMYIIANFIYAGGFLCLVQTR